MKERWDLVLLLIRLKHKTALEYVLLMKAIRSTLTMKYFVKEWKNPLLIMTRIMIHWWWTRQTWTSEFQDNHIPLWNTRKVPAFDNWFRKLRTTQIDTLNNKIYDRINHLILSVQNQNKWFRMLGTSNYANYSRRNPKRSAKYIYHTRTLALSTARAGTSCVKKEGANQKFIKCTMGLLSIPDYVIKKGRPHGHRYGKKPGDKEYNIANQLKKKCKKRCFQGIHDRFIRDEQFRNPMIENGRDEDVCRQMDDLADEDHTHHLTHKNISIAKVIGGSVRTRQVPILCQCSAYLTSNKHCLPCSNWKKKKKKLNETIDGHRVLLLHGGVGKVLGRFLIPMKVTMEMNQVLIEQGDLLYKYLEQFFKAWFSWIHLFCYRWIVYSWRRSTVTDGVCKYHTSNDVFLRCKKCAK